MKRIQLEGRNDLKSEIPLEAPYSIFIDPSSFCNFSCKFCMNHKISKKYKMDFNVYKKIIDDLQEFKKPIKVIRLYGFGEPLINNDFPEMVKYAKNSSKVLSVDTTTNGSLLNNKLSKKIIESGIDRINISIEGISDEQYVKFTGKTINFKNLVKNIKYLYDISGDTIIFAKIAGDYLTKEEKQKFYEIFTPITDGCDVEHNMNCWYDMEFEGNNEVGIYGQPRENVEVCPYIFYSFMIQPDGYASLCFLDWDKRMIIGDLTNQSVKEIWNSDILKKYRINMLNGIKNNICKNCDQLKAGMPVHLDSYRIQLLERIKKT